MESSDINFLFRQLGYDIPTQKKMIEQFKDGQYFLDFMTNALKDIEPACIRSILMTQGSYFAQYANDTANSFETVTNFVVLKEIFKKSGKRLRMTDAVKPTNEFIHFVLGQLGVIRRAKWQLESEFDHKMVQLQLIQNQYQTKKEVMANLEQELIELQRTKILEKDQFQKTNKVISEVKGQISRSREQKLQLNKQRIRTDQELLRIEKFTQEISNNISRNQKELEDLKRELSLNAPELRKETFQHEKAAQQAIAINRNIHQFINRFDQSKTSSMIKFEQMILEVNFHELQKNKNQLMKLVTKKKKTDDLFQSNKDTIQSHSITDKNIIDEMEYLRNIKTDSNKFFAEKHAELRILNQNNFKLRQDYKIKNDILKSHELAKQQLTTEYESYERQAIEKIDKIKMKLFEIQSSSEGLKSKIFEINQKTNQLFCWSE